MHLVTRGLGGSCGNLSGFEIEMQIEPEIFIDVELNDEQAYPAVGVRERKMRFNFKQGEGKVLAFRMSRGEEPFSDLVGVESLTFALKKNKKDTACLIQKQKTDFQLESNVAKLPITSDETKALVPGTYVGELTVVISSSDTTKSTDVVIEIERAVSE